MSDQMLLDDEPDIPLDEPEIALDDEPTIAMADGGAECDCIASGNEAKPKQHGADPHAKNCAVYIGAAPPAVIAQQGLVEVLPVGFQLPKLIRFVPDVRLQQTADQATKYALSIEVKDVEGLKRADAALIALRTAQAAIVDHFKEPADLANEVHKSITGRRATWLQAGADALSTVGKRIATEQTRLQRVAAEAKRKLQEEEDRKARERAREEAARAEKAKAPAPVVAQMRKAAETVTAPPVQATAEEAPRLTGSTVTKTWKCRIAGTPAEDDPLPPTSEITPAQQVQIFVLLKAIIDGRAPIACISIDTSYVNSRAKADKATFAIPGLEAFEDLGVRSKGGRNTAR